MATRLKVRVCTWNVGNAPPPANLSAWLGTDSEVYDLIVVGVQESSYACDRAVPTTVAPGTTRTSGSLPSPATSEFSPSERKLRSSASLQAQKRPKGSGRFGVVSKAIRSVRRKRPRSNPAAFSRTDAISQTLATPLSGPWSECAFQERSGVNILSDLTLDCATSAPSTPSGRCCHEIPLFTHNQTSPPRPAFHTPHRNPTHLCEISEACVSNHIHALYSNPPTAAVNVESKVQRPPPLSIPSTVAPPTQAYSGCMSGTNDQRHVAIDSPDASSADDLAIFSSDSPTSFHAITPPGFSGTAQQSKFSKVVSSNMPEDYHLVVKGNMMEMRLMVYIHDRQRHLVHEKKVFAEATGIGNVVGNKGAVIAKIVLDGTSFCFINSHLAAHEGKRYMKSRNEDVIEIMRGAERCGTPGIPMLHSFDHVFWLGDLNYRLDMHRLPEGPNRWPRTMQLGYISRLAKQKRFAEIAELDELRNEIVNNSVFVGFSEAPLTFPPTFKVERGRGNVVEYQDTRLPAYCDRIMYHSRPSHQLHVKCKEYDCVPSIDTSDHKPVFGVFEVAIPRRMLWVPHSATNTSFKCAVSFLRVEVHSFGVNGRSYGAPWSGDARNLRNEGVGDGTIRLDGNGSLVTLDGISGDASDGRCENEAVNDAEAGPMGRVGSYFGELGTRLGIRHGSDSSVSSSDSSGSLMKKYSAFGDCPRRAQMSIHGEELLTCGRVHKVEVGHIGEGRYCERRSMPYLMVKPVAAMSELRYKYITLAFDRIGTKNGSACVLPMADLATSLGKRRFTIELPLTKYGPPVGTVRIDVQVNISPDGWYDANDRPMVECACLSDGECPSPVLRM